MAGPDYEAELKALDATLRSIEAVLDLDAMRKEVDELNEQVSAPDLWDDQANAQRVTSRLAVLQADLERVSSLRRRVDDTEVLVELAEAEDDADTRAEIDKELADLHRAIEALEVRTLL